MRCAYCLFPDTGSTSVRAEANQSISLGSVNCCIFLKGRLAARSTGYEAETYTRTSLGRRSGIAALFNTCKYRSSIRDYLCLDQFAPQKFQRIRGREGGGKCDPTDRRKKAGNSHSDRDSWSLNLLLTQICLHIKVIYPPSCCFYCHWFVTHTCFPTTF